MGLDRLYSFDDPYASQVRAIGYFNAWITRSLIAETESI
jgi:hypothetical protein